MDDPGSLAVRTLTDGGQTAEDIAADLCGFLGSAHTSLDLALYDVRLPGAVAGALRAALDRGVAVRLLYNLDEHDRVPVPPPPETVPEILESLPVRTRPVPGEPDLMHHKYVVRDGTAVWTGSTNWSLNSWERQENVVVQVDSAAIGAAFARNFDELWRTQRVEGSGAFDQRPVELDGARVRPWFTPGRGEELSHRIAKAIGRARTRVRIASPVLTAGPILGTLAEVTAEGRVDVKGVCDWTQLSTVFEQWEANPRSAWKGPLLARVIEGAQFHGKRSIPWGRGTVHDFMHAKVTVADDTVFAGSFNLSRSGELNAENVLEIESPALAGRLAAYVDEVRARYADVSPPPELLPRPLEGRR